MALGPTLEMGEMVMLAAVLGAISAPIVWVWRDNRASIHKLHERVDLLKAANDAKVEILKDTLASYQREADRTFASHDTIARVEKRLVASEERMAALFDKLGERIDRSLEAIAHGKSPQQHPRGGQQ